MTQEAGYGSVGPVVETLRRIVGALATVGLVVSVVWLFRAERGVRTSQIWVGPTPVTLFRSVDGFEGAPLVVISHGFAGSQQLMRPFAVTLARAGYVAATFDYLGHGRNLDPLRGDVTKVEGATQRLLEQTSSVVDGVFGEPGLDGRLAIVGHSMASDIVVRYAQRDSRVEATVAVSMFSPAVTSTSPPNLLILVGGLERGLRQEALRVLKMGIENPQAFHTYGDFGSGSARRLALAPYREHLGVLYEPSGLFEARSWLDQVFARDSRAPVDRRGSAILLLFMSLGLMGWPLFSILPRVSQLGSGPRLSWSKLCILCLVPALATPLMLVSFPADFMSVLVGGYLAVHFGVYGLLTWITTRVLLGRPATAGTWTWAWALRMLGATSLATSYAAGAVALAMDATFTSFAMTAPRWPLFLVMSLGTGAYFLADESFTAGSDAPRGSRLLTRCSFLASLGLAVALSFEELFFLLIIAILIVPYFMVYGLWSDWIHRATGHPAVGAIASATAFAWTIAVVFPMLAG
ncbi:MAG: alpha/beta fold hydrolase [Myxococcota bacterium]